MLTNARWSEDPAHALEPTLDPPSQSDEKQKQQFRGRYAETRYSRQVPWRASAHSRLHLNLWQALAVASLVLGVNYLYWRWTQSLNFDALWLSLPLVLAETLAFLGLALFVFNIWTPAASARPGLPASYRDVGEAAVPDDRAIIVDVFFTTYDETAELLREGVDAAKQLRYPHPIDLRIHVLDDGQRPEIRDLAESEGVNYITRTGNSESYQRVIV